TAVPLSAARPSTVARSPTNKSPPLSSSPTSASGCIIELPKLSTLPGAPSPSTTRTRSPSRSWEPAYNANFWTALQSSMAVQQWNSELDASQAADPGPTVLQSADSSVAVTFLPSRLHATDEPTKGTANACFLPPDWNSTGGVASTPSPSR